MVDKDTIKDSLIALEVLGVPRRLRLLEDRPRAVSLGRTTNVTPAITELSADPTDPTAEQSWILKTSEGGGGVIRLPFGMGAIYPSVTNWKYRLRYRTLENTTIEPNASTLVEVSSDPTRPDPGDAWVLNTATGGGIIKMAMGLGFVYPSVASHAYALKYYTNEGTVKSVALT